MAPGELLAKPGTFCTKISRQLIDISAEIDALGLFGGNLAIQSHTYKLQTLANVTDIEDKKRVYSMAVSQLGVIRYIINLN